MLVYRDLIDVAELILDEVIFFSFLFDHMCFCILMAMFDSFSVLLCLLSSNIKHLFDMVAVWSASPEEEKSTTNGKKRQCESIQ